MRLVTGREVAQWLASHGLLDADADSRKIARQLIYSVPPDCERKTALARILTRAAFRSSNEVVLGVLEHGIWSSSENLKLFMTYRRSIAGELDLDKYPGHVASGDDVASVEGLLALSLYFCWGVELASENGMDVFISHDEWLEVLSDDTLMIEHIVDLFAEFGLAADPSHQFNPHWDVDDGDGGRNRYDENGAPVK